LGRATHAGLAYYGEGDEPRMPAVAPGLSVFEILSDYPHKVALSK